MRIRHIFDNDDLPVWFVVISYFGLVPIICWPLMLFASMFLFDNPQDAKQITGDLSIMLGYPFLLIGNFILCNYLYRKNKILGSIFLLTSIFFIYYI